MPKIFARLKTKNTVEPMAKRTWNSIVIVRLFKSTKIGKKDK